MMATLNYRWLIALSILAAVLTMGLKTLAWWLTGSVGLLSDAAESGVNLVAAITAGFCLWFSARPVDANHTYGHDKIEFFSSGLEGVLVMVAAVGIFTVALQRLFAPTELQALDVGLLVSIVASVINFVVAKLLLRVGRAKDSIVLEADGEHLMTDVWTSGAIIFGVGLVWLTGVKILDPICALLVALSILWTGFGLVRRSFDGLMDHALPEAEQTKVRTAIESQLRPGVTYHALRTRQAGTRRFVDFHLLVPGVSSVMDAHTVANAIEAAIQQHFTEAEVVIHIEPIEAPESWCDSPMLPVERGGK